MAPRSFTPPSHVHVTARYALRNRPCTRRCFLCRLYRTRGANSGHHGGPERGYSAEWNDILRNHGILPAKEKQLTEEDIADVVLEAQKEQEASRLQDAGIDEIDALLEEALDDDRVLLEYRKKRIEEMRQAAAKEKFGSVTEISENDFVKEVTEASKDAPVVVHLYQNSILGCRILNERLSALAKKYRSTKFTKIVASKCIHGYPDHNCPTMLVYVGGDMRKQLVGPQACAVAGSERDLEKLLGLLGVLTLRPDEEEEEGDA